MNSKTFNGLLKPMQARGKYGPRHFHKKPLEFPIPRFNSNDYQHNDLVKQGLLAAESVRKIIPSLNEAYSGKIIMPQHVSKIRSQISEVIKNQLELIDEIVVDIFSTTGSSSINDIIKEHK